MQAVYGYPLKHFFLDSRAPGLFFNSKDLQDLYENPLPDTRSTGHMETNTQIHTHAKTCTHTLLLYYSPSLQEANDCFFSDHPSLFAIVQTGLTGVLTQRHHQPHSLHAFPLLVNAPFSHHFKH